MAKFGFGKNKGGNTGGKDYDVMNPEAVNPNAKKAGQQLGKLAKKLAKAIGKLIKKLFQLLLKLGWVGIIIILIIIIILVIVAFQHMPGMMKDKLLSLFKIDPSKWFANGAVSSLDEDYQDIIDVSNYLEQMDYNLIGDGFVRPKLRTGNDDIFTRSETQNNHPEYEYRADDEGVGHFYDGNNIVQDLKYYDFLGRTIDNATGEPISDDTYIDEYGIERSMEETNGMEGDSTDSRGKVANIEKEDLKNYKLIRTYLLSNYRIYTLRNSDEDMLTKIYNAICTVSGNDDAWAKGLIKLYNATGGIATDHWWWGRGLLGESVSLTDTTLSLKKGWFNNAMNFSIEGWAPRYGMSLEFLLSLHLGTGAPDLTTAMLQNFDTEVQVYLDGSGEAQVNASFVDPHKVVSPEAGDTIDKVERVLEETGHDFVSWMVTDQAALEWFANDISLTKEACQDLLRSKETFKVSNPELCLTLTSPDNCMGVGQAYKILDSAYQTSSFLWFDTSSNNLTSYGITSAVDEEVYDEFTSYEHYEFKDDDGGDVPFDMEHCTQGLGTDHPEALNDDFSWISGVAVDNGFNMANRTEPQIKEFEINRQTGGYGTLQAKGKVYKVKRVKNINSWTSGVDSTDPDTGVTEPEEVGFDWVNYKYLIYEAGTYTQDADEYTSYAYEGVTSYFVSTWKDPVVTYSDEEKWVDTVIVEFVIREKTTQEAIESGILVKDETTGNYHYDLSKGKCDQQDISKCCSACQKYVKAAVKAMASVSDQDYEAYTPYIARVVGSWFRDTYFIIPRSKGEEGNDRYKTEDVAINEYAGKISVKPRSYTENSTTETENVVQGAKHPEFDYLNSFGTDATYVRVDTAYLEDTGEYWTAYDMKDGTEEYQLYVLNGDGTTSDVTLEDFLENGFTYEGEQLVAPGQFKDKDEAEAAGWAFVKKAQLEKFVVNTDMAGDRVDDRVLWSAYGFDSNGSTTNWEKVKREDKNTDVNNLYNIIYGGDSEGDDSSGVFYQITQTNNVTQAEDAQRGQTNPLVKYLFKYRKFYIYDGGETRGLAIEHDKQRVLYGYNYYCNQQYDYNNEFYNEKVIADPDSFKEEGYETYITDNNFYHFIGLLDNDYNGNNGLIHQLYKSPYWRSIVITELNNYGRSAIRESYSWATNEDFVDDEDLAMQWLDWQLDMLYMHRFGVDINKYYDTDDELLVLNFDPRDPDLIGTVQITKSSLSVFSILENAGTLDADYAYRDFKELIVELDYFDKEELSDKIPSIFTWVLPEHDPPIGWPVRPFDKADVDYGTMIHSKATYDALESYVTGKKLDELTASSQTNAGTGDPQTGTTEPQTGTTEPQTGTTEPQTGGDSEPQNSSSKKIDSSKIFWIGDSWIAGLGVSGAADSPAGSLSDGAITSGYFFCKGGMNADWVLSNYSSMSIPSDASAIVVEFGLNGVTNWSRTQELIDKLKADHGNIEVFVLQTSHICSGYPYDSPKNSEIDTYNENMKNYADSKDGVTYIDPTGNIQGSDGYLKNEYAQNPNDTNRGGGKIHLNSDGYKVWYQDIIDAMGNTSSTTKLEKFEGYEAGELVSSPVTGKILEVGKHQRMNLYTQQMEEVEYIIIEAMKGEDYFTPEMFEGYEYETTSVYFDTPDKALNIFGEEYENVCAGYTIMIDGIDVDLSLTSADSGTSDEPTDPAEPTTDPEPSTEPQGGDNENQNSINGSFKKREEEDLRGLALYNTTEWDTLVDKEQAKEDAPCFINYGEDKAYPTPEDNYKAEDGLVGYYVKEGKFIGKTIANEVVETTTPTADPEPEPEPEPTAEPNPDNPTSDSEDAEKLTYTYYDYTGPADYIRIIIKDLDYAIVDNVEDFFYIPEVAGTEPFNGEYSEEFLYWMLVLCEGLKQEEVRQGYSVAQDIGDGTVTVAMGVTNWCNGYFWNLGYGEYMHGSHASNTGMNVGDHVPLDVIRDVAIAFIDDKVASIQQVFPGMEFDEYQTAAILSVMYNFGSVPDSLQTAIKSGDEANIRNVWENLGSSQWDDYPGLEKRRKAESVMFLDKKWTAPYSGVELQFSTDTPFSDYFSGKNFNVASE